MSIVFSSLDGSAFGSLIETEVEIPCKGSYRWKKCIALVDSRGRWLCNEYWRVGAFKKAERDILSWGTFKKIL